MRWLRLPLAILSVFLLTNTAASQDWPRFRGPNGSGVSAATTVPAQWTEQECRWKIRLPGPGHSSPVVRGSRIFVTCADEQTGTRIVLSYSVDDGRRLWQRDFGGEKHRKHEDNSFASATPAIDERHLYVAWANAKEYLVAALTHDGQEVWRTDLGTFRAGHGFGASPIVHADIVVVPNDQDGTSTLIGLDRDTGKVRWQVPRKSKSTYSTPCVYQRPGRPAALIFTNYEHGVTSIDPATGRLNWELDVFDKKHIETAIPSPIVADELVLASCGWLGVRQEVVAVQPPAKGEGSAHKVYCLDRAAPLCTTPLAKDGLVFLWSDRGIVSCADARTGEVYWRERVAGSFYSSPICMGEQLCNVSREGDFVVLAAGKRFELLATNRLSEGSHSTPAVAGGRLYVRTFRHLLCVGGDSRK
jgi:outer membrane protein assembly factor BamB